MPTHSRQALLSPPPRENKAAGYSPLLAIVIENGFFKPILVIVSEKALGQVLGDDLPPGLVVKYQPVILIQQQIREGFFRGGKSGHATIYIRVVSRSPCSFRRILTVIRVSSSAWGLLTSAS
jgi:hypothetical protein